MYNDFGIYWRDRFLFRKMKMNAKIQRLYVFYGTETNSQVSADLRIPSPLKDYRLGMLLGSLPWDSYVRIYYLLLHLLIS